MEQTCKPDLRFDFRKPFPFPDSFVDEIKFFHVIEHIEERFHKNLLHEFWRVLKPGGKITISYPEFTVIAKNYIENKQGKRDFWKATLYGRQLYPTDYHIALMDSRFFYDIVEECGFSPIIVIPEPGQEFNSVLQAFKAQKKTEYADLIKKMVFEK